jgi:pilus assembly protein CpaE
VIVSIDTSSRVCMVGMLDSLSLKNTKLGLETLELMGYDPEHIKLVLNRAGSKVGITADDVRTIVGRDPDVMIPSDREIPRALNEGQPIVVAKGDSDAAHAFAILAGHYIRTDSASRNGSENGGASRRRLFGRKS